MDSGVVFFALFTVIAVFSVYLLASTTIGLLPVCIIGLLLTGVALWASRVIADRYNARKQGEKKNLNSGSAVPK